ncbi:MAG: hypothetical protein A2Y17_08720 [Clostridiales bacterium GWF2_38_85]|nr:MAG: hypothetical protein A2Y17_08720 [Clostridiales bacterium GWF2_38_85]HBL83722.1 50S ribosomal protein L7ae-like protein [Clostridiales bacterium]
MLADHTGTRWAIGANQTIKLIRTRKAKIIYLANDADRQFKAKILDEVNKHGSIPIDNSFNADELGAQCGIDVSCAVVAIY